MNFAIMGLALFATARLNRLITTDVITAPARTWLDKRTGPVSRFLSAVTSCDWCTGVYTATAVAAYTHYVMAWNWWLLPLSALSLAWLAPILARWTDA